MLERERVGSLDRQAEGSAPDLGGGNTERSRYTKDDGVVVLLRQAVMLEQSAGAGIDVGEGVLDLARLRKLYGNDLVVGLDQVDEVVVLDVALGKVKLAYKARISLAEDRMAVTRHNAAGLEGVFDMFCNISLGPGITILLLGVKDEAKALLIGKAVERAGETVHTGRE